MSVCMGYGGWVCLCACTYMCKYTYMCMRVCVSVCFSVHECLCVHVCMPKREGERTLEPNE